MQEPGTTTLLQYGEVVRSTFAVSRAKDTLAALCNEDLALMGVVFLLTRVVSSL